MFVFYYCIMTGLISMSILILRANHYMRHPEKYTDLQYFHLAQKFMYKIQSRARIKTVYFGRENLPSADEGGYLLISNHQGKYDAIGILAGLDDPTAVLLDERPSYKPAVKQMVDLVRGKRINLQNIRNQLKVVREIGTEVRDNGYRILIFPEGGYSDNKNNLQQFHDGCFLAATIAHCPLVPVCIVDSYLGLNRNNPFRRVTTEVHFLPPVPYSEYEGMKRPEIAALMKEKIQACMDEVLAARAEHAVVSAPETETAKESLCPEASASDDDAVSLPLTRAAI